MARLISFFLISLSLMAQAYASNFCAPNSIIVLNSQIFSLAKANIEISQIAAAQDPLAKSIPNQENDLIKVAVRSQMNIPNTINLESLIKRPGFFNKAFGKNVEFQQNDANNFSAKRSVLGVDIEFQLHVKDSSEKDLSIIADNYSIVFRNSLIKIRSIENPDGSSDIKMEAVSFIKKSSYEKLQTATFGGADKFIKSQIEKQLAGIETVLREEQ